MQQFLPILQLWWQDEHKYAPRTVSITVGSVYEFTIVIDGESVVSNVANLLESVSQLVDIDSIGNNVINSNIGHGTVCNLEAITDNGVNLLTSVIATNNIEVDVNSPANLISSVSDTVNVDAESLLVINQNIGFIVIASNDVLLSISQSTNTGIGVTITVDAETSGSLNLYSSVSIAGVGEVFSDISFGLITSFSAITTSEAELNNRFGLNAGLVGSIDVDAETSLVSNLISSGSIDVLCEALTDMVIASSTTFEFAIVSDANCDIGFTPNVIQNCSTIVNIDGNANVAQNIIAELDDSVRVHGDSYISQNVINNCGITVHIDSELYFVTNVISSVSFIAEQSVLSDGIYNIIMTVDAGANVSSEFNNVYGLNRGLDASCGINSYISNTQNLISSVSFIVDVDSDVCVSQNVLTSFPIVVCSEGVIGSDLDQIFKVIFTHAFDITLYLQKEGRFILYTQSVPTFIGRIDRTRTFTESQTTNIDFTLYINKEASFILEK